MLFFIFSLLVGLVLFLAPLIISKRLSQKWQINRKIFWRAGVFHALIMLIYLSVLGNLDAVFPSINNLGEVWQSLIAAAITGLFIELGRFVVLDRFMKNVRSSKEAIYFGFSWAGFYALVIGIFTIINAFGMYYLMNTSNIATQFPQATTEQIQLLEEAKKQSAEDAQNPYMAFAPLIENASLIMIDIAMTILILLAITKPLTRFVWLAVGFKVLANFGSFALANVNIFLSEAILILFAVISYFLIKLLLKNFVRPTSSL